MRKKLNKNLIILSAIILLAIFLRTVDLNNNPRSNYGDGLTLVYDAYSILKTGHDQKGNFLPLVFELGGSRPPGYVYATIPFTAIFGPSDIAAKSVSILSGIGLVILMYFLGKRLLDHKLSLIAAFFAAISPWDLSLSRGTFETHFAMFLSLVGFLTFLKARENYKWYIASAIFFGLAIQTYPTYRLTIPLFLALLVFLNREKLIILLKTKRLLSVICLAIFFSSFFLSVGMVAGNPSDRFSDINILSQKDTLANIHAEINYYKSEDQLPPLLSKIIHNSPLEYTELLVTNYVGNIRPEFLFISGDKNPLHNPAEMGEFYWADAFLIVVGILFIYRKSKDDLKLLVGWILIAPIATSLVGEPHALRSSFLIPPILLLSSFGFYRILDKRRPGWAKTILTIVLILFFIQAPFLIDKFYFLSPNKNANLWSYPAKQATLLARENISKYNFIILSTNIPNMEFAYPVYADLDPNTVIYQNQHINTPKQNMGNSRFLQYNHVYIGEISRGNLKPFLNSLPGSVLYIGNIEDKNYIDGYSIDINADHVPDLVIYTRNGNPT